MGTVTFDTGRCFLRGIGFAYTLPAEPTGVWCFAFDLSGLPGQPRGEGWAQGVDIVTLQQLLGHSTVTVTMRYTHTNLDAKRNATQKLEGFSDNLVTPCTKLQQSNPKVSPITPLKAVASYT